MRSRLLDLRAALTTWPSARDWARCAALYLLFLACAFPIGWTAGLIAPSAMPMTPGAAAALAAIVFVHPAFFEELIFRALLLPNRPREIPRGRLVAIAAVALALYVAAHPLNAWLFSPWLRGLFTSPSYLVLAGLLGLTCTLAYFASSSIWPPVLIHWLTVVSWILWLGGNRLLRPA